MLVNLRNSTSFKEFNQMLPLLQFIHFQKFTTITFVVLDHSLDSPILLYDYIAVAQ